MNLPKLIRYASHFSLHANAWQRKTLEKKIGDRYLFKVYNTDGSIKEIHFYQIKK